MVDSRLTRSRYHRDGTPTAIARSMRSIKSMIVNIVLVSAATAATGCGNKKVSVDVQCEAKSREAITCDVKQTSGKDEVEACWDVRVDCPNGTVLDAPHTCQKVKGGGSETATIPSSTIENVENCQGGQPKLALSNLTINGKKAN